MRFGFAMRRIDRKQWLSVLEESGRLRLSSATDGLLSILNQHNQKKESSPSTEEKEEGQKADSGILADLAKRSFTPKLVPTFQEQRTPQRNIENYWSEFFLRNKNRVLVLDPVQNYEDRPRRRPPRKPFMDRYDLRSSVSDSKAPRSIPQPSLATAEAPRSVPKRPSPPKLQQKTITISEDITTKSLAHKLGSIVSFFLKENEACFRRSYWRRCNNACFVGRNSGIA